MPPLKTFVNNPIKQQALGLFKSYKRGARKRGLTFAISFNRFLKITKQRCSYCGITPVSKYRNSNANPLYYYIYNGIDRMDSEVGYISGNITPCCSLCNSFKGTYSVELFLEHCGRIWGFQKKSRRN